MSCFLAFLQNCYKIVNRYPEVTETTIVPKTEEHIASTHTDNGLNNEGLERAIDSHFFGHVQPGQWLVSLKRTKPRRPITTAATEIYTTCGSGVATEKDTKGDWKLILCSPIVVFCKRNKFFFIFFFTFFSAFYCYIYAATTCFEFDQILFLAGVHGGLFLLLSSLFSHKLKPARIISRATPSQSPYVSVQLL